MAMVPPTLPPNPGQPDANTAKTRDRRDGQDRGPPRRRPPPEAAGAASLPEAARRARRQQQDQRQPGRAEQAGQAVDAERLVADAVEPACSPAPTGRTGSPAAAPTRSSRRPQHGHGEQADHAQRRERTAVAATEQRGPLRSPRPAPPRRRTARRPGARSSTTAPGWPGRCPRAPRRRTPRPPATARARRRPLVRRRAPGRQADRGQHARRRPASRPRRTRRGYPATPARRCPGRSGPRTVAASEPRSPRVTCAPTVCGGTLLRRSQPSTVGVRSVSTTRPGCRVETALSRPEE